VIKGRCIRMFLVDGSPSGIITAEIMNWTGHVLAALRALLSDLLKRSEIMRMGIYFLTGPRSRAPSDPVLVGQPAARFQLRPQHQDGRSQTIIADGLVPFFVSIWVAGRG